MITVAAPDTKERLCHTQKEMSWQSTQTRQLALSSGTSTTVPTPDPSTPQASGEPLSESQSPLQARKVVQERSVDPL